MKLGKWRGLTLTNAAVQQINNLVNKDTCMLGVRLYVRKSGCAGLSYMMDTVTHSSSSESELVFERNGARLYVPLEAMPFIDGTELDYVKEGLNHIFKFNNPNAQYACGCGESFGLVQKL